MNMKRINLAVLIIAFLSHTAFAQVTSAPKVEEQSAPYVKIKKVELTKEFTVIYLQFVENGKPTPFDQFPDLKMQIGGSTISLNPDTRLYKPGDVNTKFKLIKTENIPTESRMKVTSGEKIDFVAYFEKLPPGMEVFDFYEGRPSSKMEQTWNFYGVHIDNPKNPAAKKQTPLAQTPIEKEKPKTAEKAPLASSAAYGVLKGQVFDAKTKKPVAAELEYVEAKDTLQVVSNSGKYRIGLDLKAAYDIRIKAKGYFGDVYTITPADSSGKTDFTNDFYLVPLKVGENIALPNIYFETSQFTLLRESSRELDRLADLLKENKSIKIKVEGHTDNVGDFDKNLELSTKRAESVKEYLVKSGIDGDRIEVQGYGSTRPLVKNGTSEQHQSNRRVEFVVIQM